MIHPTVESVALQILTSSSKSHVIEPRVYKSQQNCWHFTQTSHVNNKKNHV